MEERKNSPHSFMQNDRETTITELMDQYGDAILRLTFTYVKNIHIAEDLSQEIFVKCYEKLASFRGEASLKNWLYRIAINHCQDYLRSGYAKYILVTETFQKFLKAKEETPEEILLKKDQSEGLTKEILALPIKYRELIFLFYFNELTTREISEVLNQNENTIKTRLRKAKELLKVQLIKSGRGMDNGR
jgi:RNA polymerase sigma-70 factor, ECF subfamily